MNFVARVQGKIDGGTGEQRERKTEWKRRKKLEDRKRRMEWRV